MQIKDILKIIVLSIFLSNIIIEGQISRGRGAPKNYTKEDYIELYKKYRAQQKEKFNSKKVIDSLKVANKNLSDTLSAVKLSDSEFEYLRYIQKYDSLEIFNAKVLRMLNNQQKYRVNRILEKPKKYPKSPLIKFRDSNGKIGYKDKDENIVVKPRFDNVWWMDRGFIKVMENKKWGLIDTLGNVVLQPNYYYTTIPQDSICRVYENGLWGYMNLNEDWIIRPRYLGASQFYSDTAMVSMETDSIFYINKSGEIIGQFDLIPKSYSELTSKKFIKELKIEESYSSIQSFLGFTLKKENEAKYSIIISPTDGEGTAYLVVQKLKYGIICSTHYYYEGYGLNLKIPNLSFKEGLLLAMKILGKNIDSYELDGSIAKFTTDNGMIRIQVTESPLGYIEIFEEWSL